MMHWIVVNIITMLSNIGVVSKTTHLTTQPGLTLIGGLADDVGATYNFRSSIVGHESMQIKDDCWDVQH